MLLYYLYCFGIILFYAICLIALGIIVYLIIKSL